MEYVTTAVIQRALAEETSVLTELQQKCVQGKLRAGITAIRHAEHEIVKELAYGYTVAEVVNSRHVVGNSANDIAFEGASQPA